MKKIFYVTTPIYYPNDKLHIGHAYTTILADYISRFKKTQGYDVFFLTGSDEHGLKVETKAKEMGFEPKAYVDKIVESFKFLWEKLGIDYDIFMRTTNPNHVEFVQNEFTDLFKKGHIYEGVYEDYYCKPCESFYTKSQLNEGKCPSCNRDVSLIKEDSYFLKIKPYKNWVINQLKNKSLIPQSRVNELMNNFLNDSFVDLSISRTNFSWGIPVRENPKHIIYVWLDALSNYASAFNFPERRNKLTLDQVWSKKSSSEILHIVGKEITRFHSIYWPIMLEMLGYKQPKVLAHGWILMNDVKMSKSLGNIVDPIELIEKYGRDAIRFYFLNKIEIENDGKFSEELLKEEINSILVNKYSNLINRTYVMLDKYFNGKIPFLKHKTQYIEKLEIEIDKCEKNYIDLSNSYNFPSSLKELIKIMDLLNKFIDETKPWNKVGEELEVLLNFLINGIFKLNILLSPILIDSTQKFFQALGLKKENILDVKIDGLIFNKIDFLFKRIT